MKKLAVLMSVLLFLGACTNLLPDSGIKTVDYLKDRPGLVADGVTTGLALHVGGSEMNPILFKCGDPWIVALCSVGAKVVYEELAREIGGEELAEKIVERTNLLGLGAAGNNVAAFFGADPVTSLIIGVITSTAYYRARQEDPFKVFDADRRKVRRSGDPAIILVESWEEADKIEATRIAKE